MTRKEAKQEIQATREVLKNIINDSNSSSREKLDASKLYLQSLGAFKEEEFKEKFPISISEDMDIMLDTLEF